MAYYDLKISRIPFAWPGKPLHGRNELATKDWFPVDVTRLSFDEWERRYEEEYGVASNETLCFVEIEDNGRHGDGIKFRICAGDSKAVIVETGIPDKSLDTLIEALTAVRRLRNAEE